MKFLIDAQLPALLASIFQKHGYEALHTLDLPDKNTTEDDYILKLSIEEKWVVISKDVDFLNTYFIKKQPYKLIHVTTGNIKNNTLLSIFRNSLSQLVKVLESHHVVELKKDSMIVIE